MITGSLTGVSFGFCTQRVAGVDENDLRLF